MKHKLPPLPFPVNALEPHMSAETLEYHYGKHHKGYVEKLNELIQGTKFENLSLEEIILQSSGSVFNNAAQAWNHTFFWNSLTPKAHQPNEQILKEIQKSFGSVDEFKDNLFRSAMSVFGSGWIWLTFDEANNKVLIETTGNAENPMKSGRVPLLVCDLWEHAYYIDYRNDRGKFIHSVMNVLNWSFAESNLDRLLSKAA